MWTLSQTILGCKYITNPVCDEQNVTQVIIFIPVCGVTGVVGTWYMASASSPGQGQGQLSFLPHTTTTRLHGDINSVLGQQVLEGKCK